MGGVRRERLELCFLPKDKGRNETRFVLFHDLANGQLNGESQFAEKWAKLITDHLKHRTHRGRSPAERLRGDFHLRGNVLGS